MTSPFRREPLERVGQVVDLPCRYGRPLFLASLLVVCLAGCNDGQLDRWFQKRSNRPPARAHPAQRTAPPSDSASGADADRPTDPIPVLTVNSESVTVEDVLAPLRADFTAKAASMSASRYWNHVDEACRGRIRGMVRDLLLFQEASMRMGEQENQMIDQFTDQRIRSVVQEDYGGRHTRWEAAMAEQGLSPEQARQRVRRDVVIYAFLERTVKPRVEEPTRRDLLRYFEEHKEEMTIPERRELFLIEVPKGDDPAAARTTIDQAAAELAGGADFGEVARKHSKGIGAADGGSWGMVDPASIRGRWEPAAQALRQLTADQTSEVIESDDAFFIVRLGRIEPRQPPDFAAVQVSLMQAYREHQFNLLVDDLVVRLQEEAEITPADPSLFLRAVLAACPQPAEENASGADRPGTDRF